MNDQQKKIAAGGGFAVLAALILFYELHDSGPVAPPPAPPTASASTAAGTAPGGSAAKHVAVTAADLDPSLHMRAMLATESLAYSGNGRNIFSANSVATTALPRPIASARPHGPVAPTAPVYTGPPPPPPIDLTFFGTATSVKAGRRALLLKGEDVFLASAGDVVQRRYKVISIASNSVVVEDLTDNHQQTLQLQRSF